MSRPPFLAVAIGTGFGAGFWPWGPGTAGAVLATAMWYVASLLVGSTGLLWLTGAAIVVFTLLGTWATERLQPFWGDDPSRVVVDEMVGVWIPLLLACTADGWWTVLASLLLFRFFDIVKPLGIRSLDRRKGAVWVMIDDIVAGIYAAVVLGAMMLLVSCL